MNPKTITALDASPIITLDECRKHCRITPDDDSPPAHPDDDLLLGYLAVAREWVEGYSGYSLTPRTFEYALDRFPTEEIKLPGAPIIAIVSVKYTDEDAVQQTLAANQYVLDDFQEPAWLLPAVDVSWPGTLGVINAVLIRYSAGFSFRTDSPQSRPLPKVLKQSVLLLLGHLYENREQSTEVSLNEIPIGVTSLCDFRRIRTGMA